MVYLNNVNNSFIGSPCTSSTYSSLSNSRILLSCFLYYLFLIIEFECGSFFIYIFHFTFSLPHLPNEMVDFDLYKLNLRTRNFI